MVKRERAFAWWTRYAYCRTRINQWNECDEQETTRQEPREEQTRALGGSKVSESPHSYYPRRLCLRIN